MIKIIFSTVLLSAVAASSFASAGAFTTSGAIESLNSKTNTVLLSGGNSFRLPQNTDLSGLSVGQKVNISWDTQNPNSLNSGRVNILELQATGINAAN